MKEWKKPICKVVELDDADVVTSSSGNPTKPANTNASFDDAKLNNQSNGNIWGR